MDGSCGPLGTNNLDYFRVSVPAGAGFRATLTSPTNQGEDLDLFVYSSTLEVLGLGLGVSTSGMVHPTEVVQLTQLATAQDVIVRVENYGLAGLLGGSTPTPTSYQLVLEALPGGACVADLLERNETAATAKAWPVADIGDVAYYSLPLRACANDVDFHTITIANAGQAQVRVKSTGTLQAQILPPGGGNAVATATTQAGYATLNFASAAGGTHLLRVSGAAAPGTDYSIEFSRGDCAAETRPDSTQATAVPYTDTVAADARACEADPDYYTFTPVQSGSVTLTLLQADFTFGDVRATVFTAATENTPLATTGTLDRVTGQVAATFNVTSGTPYFVKVVSVGGLGDTRYDLVLNGVPVCVDDVNEPNDSAATATPLTGTTEQQRHCGSADPDNFTFTTAAAGPTRVLVQRFPTDAPLNVTVSRGGSAVSTTNTTMGDTLIYTFNAVAGAQYVVAVSNPSAGSVVDYLVATSVPPPANDTCAGAIRLSGNQTVTGTTEGAANDVDVALNASWCIRYATPGSDVVYSVTVPNGATLTAGLTTTATMADFQLLLLDGCNTACCFAGADSNGNGQAETLSYTNSTGASQTLFLVVDGYSTTEGTFGLQVSVQ